MSLKDRFNSANAANIKNTNNSEEKFDYEVKEEIYGSLGVLDSIMLQENVNSIFVNGAKNIYIEKNGKISKSTSTFRDDVQLENLIKRYIQSIYINNSENYIKFNHSYGINVSVILPPLSQKTVLLIKSYKDSLGNLQSLQDNFSISKEAALFLEAISTLKLNIIIAGEESSLKTTLLSALAKKTQSMDRSYMLDNMNEVKIEALNFSNFDFSQVSKEKSEDVLCDLLKSNPQKIFANNPDKETIKAILKSAFLNKKGLNFTFCANSKKEALEELEFLINKEVLKAKEKIFSQFDLLIYTKKTNNGARKIDSISHLLLDENNNCVIKDIFKLNQDEQMQSCGYIPSFYNNEQLGNLLLGLNIFDENYKHTYSQKLIEASIEPKKNLNEEVLAKFKKPSIVQEPVKEIENEILQSEEKKETDEITADKSLNVQNEVFDNSENELEAEKENLSSFPKELLQDELPDDISLDELAKEINKEEHE